MALLFSDDDKTWQTIPPWVGSLIGLGYNWPDDPSRQRRISLISMPCDSAAAGLISLGALVRDLANGKANDVDGHYESLMRYAHQYLESCRVCQLIKCDPDIKRCGYITKATGRLRTSTYPRRTYLISGRTNFKERQIAWHFQPPRGSLVTEFPNPTYAIRWNVEGEPSVLFDNMSDQISEAPYLALVPDARILPDNLRKAWSGLV